MIICFLTWIFLSLIGSLIFISFFSFLIEKKDISYMLVNYFFIAIFAGSLILANFLLIISFITPLRLNCLLGIILIFIIRIFCIFDTEYLREILKIFLVKIHILAISSVITFFFINIPYESTVDMLIYHIQLSRYLHDYGLVKGLALISAQLGHQSIWFALPAPLEDILNVYSSLIVGAFSYFLSICQLLQSLYNIKEGKKEEVFLASYLLFCLTSLSIMVQPTSVEMAISFLLGTSIFFCIKTITKPHSYNEYKENKSYLTFFWITLVLSSSSLGLKLTSIPIFLIGVFLFIHNLKFSKIQNFANQSIKFSMLFIFFFLPKTFALILASGCPFYPSSFLHVKVPWFVGEEFSRTLVRHISAYAKFGTLDYPEHVSNWFSLWSSRYEGKSVVFFIYFFIFLLPCTLFFLRYKILEHYKLYIAAKLPLLLGIIYTFSLAPSARFILPYIIGIAALHVFFISLENINISLFAMILSLSAAESLYSGIKSTAANFVLLFLVAVYYFINGKYLTTLLKFVSLKNFLLNSSYYITLSLYSFTENPLILPDKSSLVRNFKKIEINSINFFCPTSHPTCGYSPLPCYQGKLWFEMPLEEVELIDKEKGIAGGFKRKNYSPE